MRKFLMVVAVGLAGLGLSACGSNACEDFADWYTDNCADATTDSGDSGECTSDAEAIAEKALKCAKANKAGACGDDLTAVGEYASCIGG